MKILVIHAAAGAGHQKAAEALYQGLIKYTPHEAVCVDALDYTSPGFKRNYQGTYFFLISRIPAIWSFLFRLFDQPCLQMLVRRCRRLYNAWNARPLEEFLKREQFDEIFSTQFLSTEVAAALKRQGKIRSRLITVITDFDVHRIWLAEGVDCYTAASDWTREKLKRLGIPEEKICVTGIPVAESFASAQDIGQLKKKLGLRENIFTVLMATGSFGIGPLEELVASLKDVQVIVICGNNQKLFEKLSLRNTPLVKILGLVDNMHEWMAVSDVMVTKPGGLSISEALVSQLPLIFFHPIPGQETHNIQVLKEYGIGLTALETEEIAAGVEVFRTTKDLHSTAVKRTKVLAKPDAVKEIIKLIK